MDAQNTQKKRRMQALGAELARLRTRAGMRAQSDLAEASGVSVRTISLIETGEKIPRVNTMRKLEKALGLEPGTTDEYLEGAREDLVPRYDASVVSPAADDLAALTPADRELVLASHAEIARRMTNLVQDRGQAEGEAWLEYVLDLRERHRPRLDEEGAEVMGTDRSA